MFGEVVRTHRRRLGLSQEDLAECSGVGVRSIGKIEAGRIGTPRPATVRLLADAFGLAGADRDRFCQAASGEPPDRPATVQARPGTTDRAVPARPGTTDRAVPAQLPADVAKFTGRVGHLAALDALLAELDNPTAAVAVGAVIGTAGVGKTALAVHWAHRARDRFPDGQLYANLRGFAPAPPLPPVEALARFLRALGVPAEQVPMEVEEAASLYRSLLAERRMLVVLDNASEPGQVRPLLPGSSRCLVLVTSRDEMAGLVARDGAHRLSLSVLAVAEAHDLLARLLGTERAAAEPAQLAELARLCAYLPLALRIAAANLDRGAYRTVGGYVAELSAGDRLAALAVDGDAQAAVRAAFDLSYAHLPEPARRLFRRSGLVPGPELTVDAAAALIGADADEARHLLGQLTDAHLLDRAGGGEPPVRDRFTCHDLLREYARERAAQEPGPVRRAAMDRLYAYYLSGAAAAADLLDPDKLRLPLPARLVRHGAPPSFTDSVQALAWLDGEQPNLVAATIHAAAHGARPVAWLLADSLRGYDRRRMHAADWQAVALAALGAAEAEDEPRAQATAHLSLGLLRAWAGRYADAIDHYERALALARSSTWLDAQAALLLNTGAVFSELGQLAEAAERARGALAVQRRAGPASRTAAALNNLGLTLTHQGKPVEATDLYGQAIVLYRQVGYRTGEAIVLANLAMQCHEAGRSAEALVHLRDALTLCSGTGDQLIRSMTLSSLSEVHCDAGRLRPALAAAGAALALARDLGGRRAETIAVYQLGRAHDRSGKPERAVELYRTALRLVREGGDRLPELDVLIGLAAAGRRLGALAEATGHATQAVTLAHRYGYRIREGRARCVLAGLYLDAGDPDSAVAEASRAAAVQCACGHPRGEADALAQLGEAIGRRDGSAAAFPHLRRAYARYAAIGAPQAEEISALLASAGG